MLDPIIVARGVTKIYGSGSTAVPALRNVELSVEPGERLAILGKSGSGKSTLMNLIGGLDVPTSGSLSVAGQNLAELGRNALADFRRDRIGFIFQAFHLVPTLDVFQNVELPLLLARVPASERRRRVDEAMAAVGLGDRKLHRPTQLSGGERQRVAVARAIVHRPSVLLADEPTGNLDSGNASAVMELLDDHVRRLGMTLLLVTHDEEMARRHAVRVVRVQDGAVLPE